MLRRLSYITSIICGLLLLATVVLWVRSYWWKDSLGRSTGLMYFASIGTSPGRLYYVGYDEGFPARRWLLRLP